MKDTGIERSTTPTGYLYACVFCIAVGAALRVLGLTARDFWLDEGYTLYFTDPRLGSFFEKIGYHAVRDPHPPLYFAVIDLWRDISDSMIWLRLSSVAAMVGAMALLWKVGARVATPLAALGAVAFFAVSQTSYYYSVELRMYALGCLLAAASLLFFVRLMTAEERVPRRDILGLALANGLLILTHYTGAFLPLCQFAAVVAAPVVSANYTLARQRLVAVALAMAGSALVFSPQLPWFLMQNGAVRENYWIPIPSPRDFVATLERLVFGRIPKSGERLATLLYGCVLASIALFAMFHIRDRRVWVLATCGFGPLLLSWVYSQFGAPVFLWRSFLYTLLPLSLLVGMLAHWAATAIRSPTNTKGATAACAIALLAYLAIVNLQGVRREMTTKAHTDYAALISDVDAQLTGNTLLVFSPNMLVGAFYYAARHNSAILDAPAHPFPKSVDDAPRDGSDPSHSAATDEDWNSLSEATRSFDRIVLIRRNSGFADPFEALLKSHPVVSEFGRYGSPVDLHVFDRR